jgi:hypothetical protein
MVNNRMVFLNRIYREIPVNAITTPSIKEMYVMVNSYLKKNGLFMGNIKSVKVSNGVLFLDGVMVARVCEKETQTYNSGAYYWEGRILAAQE